MECSKWKILVLHRRLKNCKFFYLFIFFWNSKNISKKMGTLNKESRSPNNQKWSNLEVGPSMKVVNFTLEYLIYKHKTNINCNLFFLTRETFLTQRSRRYSCVFEKWWQWFEKNTKTLFQVLSTICELWRINLKEIFYLQNVSLAYILVHLMLRFYMNS